ncbi:hypothetical protein [Cupriavidus basilensis]|uniref:hypothetical protein n=1 Tax=Cupriavidus basilensis TaxID=68895 RepID=UPI0020A6C296|nr:hypothetical protein [Cupriavidus basilensis]MCP3017988.1 hypothetical protein [Cupriavidus basilensis]
MTAVKIEVDVAKLAQAFNQWMDDYTKNPDAYRDVSTSALEFLRERLDGKEPTYGDECAAVLIEYIQGQS